MNCLIDTGRSPGASLGQGRGRMWCRRVCFPGVTEQLQEMLEVRTPGKGPHLKPESSSLSSRVLRKDREGWNGVSGHYFWFWGQLVFVCVRLVWSQGVSCFPKLCNILMKTFILPHQPSSYTCARGWQLNPILFGSVIVNSIICWYTQMIFRIGTS